MLRLKTGLEGEESNITNQEWLELCDEFKENGLLMTNCIKRRKPCGVGVS